MKKGFSLVELLVALIAISCIIAAFAPVMTKKMKGKVNVEGKNSGGQNNKLFLVDSSDCSLVSGQNYVKCDFAVPKGVTKLNAILVSGGGGGGGAVSSGGEYSIGTYTAGSASVPLNTTRIKINYLVGAGGPSGTSGHEVFVNNYKNICNSIGAKEINSSVTYTSSGAVSFVDKYCWLTDIDKSKYETGRYSGSCRIPASNNYTREEICYTNSSTFCKDSFGDGWFAPPSDSIMSSNEYRVLFKEAYERNTGAFEDELNMYNSHIYSQEGVLEYTGYAINKVISYYKPAQNVCVKEKKSIADTYLYGGGGGSSGEAIIDYEIPQSTVQKLTGSTINITLPSASGLTGDDMINAASCQYIDDNQNSYRTICYSVYNRVAPNRNTESTYRTNAGNYTILKFSKGGASLEIAAAPGEPGKNHGFYKSSFWGEYSINNENYIGTGGKITSYKTYFIDNGLGITKDTSFNRYIQHVDGSDGQYKKMENWITYNDSGETGYSISSLEHSVKLGAGGKFASNFGLGTCGAGAGGLDIIFYPMSNSIDSKYSGLKGSPGCAKVTLYGEYQGAPGGGGGGGSKARFVSIPVTPNQKITVYVGKGGAGGYESDGSSGGMSKIIIDSKSYTIDGGSGGKRGNAQTASNAASSGSGGLKGTWSNSGGLIASEFTSGKDGSVGVSSSNTGYLSGGNGGSSAVEINTYACGGYQGTAPCNNSSDINGKSLEFKIPGDIFATSGVYGSAGAGGGGGGYMIGSDSIQGKGGNGQNGYVYLYWENP